MLHCSFTHQLYSVVVISHYLTVNLPYVFTWLNAVALLPKFEKSVWRLFKFDHYSILRDEVYIHNFEIHCGTNQVRLLLKVRHLTK